MLTESVIEWSDGGGQPRIARKPVTGREQVAKFFSRIYARGEVSLVQLDLVTGPALDVRVPAFRHILDLEFDGGQIAALRVQANPDKLSALR